MSKEILIDKLKSIWQKSKLLASDIIETPPVCFSYESETYKSIIGTLGNFTLITGRAKSRKTFFISVLGAIALNNGTHLGIKASFPDSQKKVLYFDTEQSKYHAKKVLTRILKINKINETEHPENLEFVLLRPFSPQTRLDVMDYIIN